MYRDCSIKRIYSILLHFLISYCLYLKNMDKYRLNAIYYKLAVPRRVVDTPEACSWRDAALRYVERGLRRSSLTIGIPLNLILQNR